VIKRRLVYLTIFLMLVSVNPNWTFAERSNQEISFNEVIEDMSVVESVYQSQDATTKREYILSFKQPTSIEQFLESKNMLKTQRSNREKKKLIKTAQFMLSESEKKF
jgi:hypothetical protein